MERGCGFIGFLTAKTSGRVGRPDADRSTEDKRTPVAEVAPTRQVAPVPGPVPVSDPPISARAVTGLGRGFSDDVDRKRRQTATSLSPRYTGISLAGIALRLRYQGHSDRPRRSWICQHSITASSVDIVTLRLEYFARQLSGR